MKVLVLLLLILTSADSIVISDDVLKVVKFGNLASNAGLVQINHQTHTNIAKLNNCQITWSSGDRFYLVSISDTERYAIKKSTYDELHKKYQNDEQISQSLADNGQICDVTILESY